MVDSNYPFPSPDWLASNKSWAAEQLDIYYQNRTGMHYSAGSMQWMNSSDLAGPMTIPYYSGSIVAFLPLQNVTKDHDSVIRAASEVGIDSVLPAGADGTILAGYKAQRDLILDLYRSAHATVQEVAFGGGNTVSIAMMKPLSRGIITINTTDPLAPPVFDFGTFTHPTDLDIAVLALKKTRAFMTSGPMLEVGAAETYPGMNVTSDADIREAIRGFATSSWQHPTCSCAMMPRELGGVVDPELRVYGVSQSNRIGRGFSAMPLSYRQLRLLLRPPKPTPFLRHC